MTVRLAEPTRRKLAFLVAGGCGFLLYNLFSQLLVHFAGAPPEVAAFLGVLSAMPIVFLMQRNFAFRHRGGLYRSFAAYCGLQLLNAACIALMVRFGRGLGLADEVNILASGATIVVLSYLVMSRLVFRSADDKDDAARISTRPRYLALGLAAASTIASVVAIAGLPVSMLAGAGHDDAWFWQRAESIVGGAWLGAYDPLTLMKGAGYPLFLALAHTFGLPLTWAQALLYASATLLLGWAVHRLGGRLWLALALTIALQWQPAAFAWGRVLRDNITAAQVLLILACVMHAAASLRDGRRGLGWMAAAGLVAGWFWCTREDSVWLLPGLAILLCTGLTGVRHGGATTRRLALGAACMAAAAGVLPGVVMAANQLHYGMSALTDMHRSAFAAALSALQRVRVGETVPYVPVPAKVRQVVYQQSPAFARLAPALEDAAKGWTRPGCAVLPVTCGDYAGGWFLWALRDAAASAGTYASASSSEAFFAQVATEVSAACDAGRLRCVPVTVPLLPGLDQFQWQDAGKSGAGFARLLLWQDARPLPVASHADHPGITRMWRFVGEPSMAGPPPVTGVRVSGWFRGPEGDWPEGRCEAGNGALPFERRPSPDVAEHFNDPGAAMSRFEVTFPGDDDCAIVFAAGQATVPLASIDQVGMPFGLGESQLFIDAARSGSEEAASNLPAPLRARQAVDALYAMALPLLTATGLFAFAAASLTGWRRKRLDALHVVAITTWCMLACRIGLLMLVDLSSFPAAKIHYLQPAFPLLIVAAFASFGALLGLRASAPPVPAA
ncbi:GtrA family protein [Silanimonas sp.]|jgi:putative flippase GtrA|uniref:GtrA family protein n=1 Tax=Silanimonas sp. TaxID=1929290 RepID=UPI0022CC448A|nr:GtrA family protein [Silanimonas sp.]MCZ8164771.1 GtrA family protein [Silanimonas sp.]